MTGYRKIVYEVERDIARIALNRPERRNALDQELLTELRDALRVSASDESVRVVLLMGAGKDFCSGMDLRTFGSDVPDDVAKFQAEARNMAGLLLDMRRHPRPIVAAVQGRALGGGCGIATAADMVLAADSAQFGYPEINIGFVPAIVMAILRRLVSEKRAFELIASGDVISAGAALDYGMINRLFAADTFDHDVEEYRRASGFQIHFRHGDGEGIVLSNGRNAVRSRHRSGRRDQRIRAHDGRLQARHRKVPDKNLIRSAPETRRLRRTDSAAP